MKAIRIHQHGGIDVLKIDEIKIPEISPIEFLIKIKAAALNHLDIWVRKGIPGVPLPIVMGSDGAGIIERVGNLVPKKKSFSKGTEVFILPFRSCNNCIFCKNNQEELCKQYSILGEHQDGTLSEYITAPYTAVMPKPPNLTWEETAAFPLSFLTAYHMLIKKANIKNNDVVFIWGATSGIGSAAVQIAKIFGATVIASAGSERKMEVAETLGADYVLNYKNENIAKRVREITKGDGVRVVFEHPGVSTWKTSLHILAKAGQIITCGATTGAQVELDLRHIFIKHQQIIGSTMGNRKDFLEIVKLIKSQKIRPLISEILTVDKIKYAHQILEDNKQIGKIVVTF
jgi:NADPH:quinone reductase-like Zn-dependent oxidoreductase